MLLRRAGSVLVCVGIGCGAPAAPPANVASEVVVTDCAKVPEHVGREVTLVGEQTRSKIPMVCGVDVDGDEALAGRKVAVRGVIRREVVTSADPTSANRGNGTFYSIVDASTGAPAKTRARD